MTSANGGSLYFNREVLDKGASVLKSAPERPAVEAVAAITVNAGAFGTVPGGAAAAGRVQQWADQGKTQMARITQDVADLGRRTGMARELIDEMDSDTQTLARSVSVLRPN
jgi:hypothetical protein